MTDAQFVMKAAQGGHREAEAGKIGVSKAACDDVRAFAQRMLTDHSAANDELARLAASKGIRVKHNAAVGFRALDMRAVGAQFDRAFMQQMVRDHEYTFDLFESQSLNGKDAELRAWAAAKLPTLREHLHEARLIFSKAYRLEYAAKQSALKEARASSVSIERLLVARW
jgi:putative membrane protein